MSQKPREIISSLCGVWYVIIYQYAAREFMHRSDIKDFDGREYGACSKWNKNIVLLTSLSSCGCNIRAQNQTLSTDALAPYIGRSSIVTVLII